MDFLDSEPPEANIADISSKFVARYLATKHSWKGKYKRIFSVGYECAATVNPGTWEITNKWDYREEFVDALPSAKSQEEFSVHLRKKKSTKTSSLTFSSPFRSELLTHLQKFREAFVMEPSKIQVDYFTCRKVKANGLMTDLILSPGAASLDQLHPYTKKRLCSYDYKDITSIDVMSDVPGGFAVNYGRYGRLHLFLCDNRDGLMKKIAANAKTYIGIDVPCARKSLRKEEMETLRYGLFSDDESITSMAEFRVLKISERSPDLIQRILCLTENCIIERDPATYGIVTLRPLADVFSIVRYGDDLQKFGIEYKSGAVRRFTSTDRDSLLASLLDGVRGSGNRDVCVKMTETIRFHRVGPWDVPVSEEIQIMYLKSLGSYTETAGISFDQMVSRFNVNIDYSGMKFTTLIDSKETELITNAVNAIMTQGQPSFETSPLAAAEQFESLRRIASSKIGFELFSKMEAFRVGLGKRVVAALKTGDIGLSYAAIDCLCALMQPMHDFYDLVQEQLNKKSLMSSRAFLTQLAQVLGKYAAAGSAALVVSALLDFFTYALCEPFSKTTDAAQFDLTLELISDLGRKMFLLFQHPSMAIVKGSGLIMRAIIEEAPEPVLQKMQVLALSEGALLKHFHTAIFTKSTDQRLLTHRELSRQLVSLWCDDNPSAQKLLKTIFPAGLLTSLTSDEAPPENQSIDIDKRDAKAGIKAKKQSTVEVLVGHWRNRSFLNSEKEKQPPPRQLVVREKHIREREKGNWPLFYYNIEQDFSRTDLIWNHRTREELREALEAELRAFNIDKELGGTQALEISWNYVEFEVKYESLSEELKIGDNYVRLLLEQGLAKNVVNPVAFFFDLYHRFLLTQNRQMKLMCLQAMAIVYGSCHDQIGPFSDTLYFVAMLSHTQTKAERDRLIIFLDKLLLVRDNTKAFIDGGGVRLLVDFLTLSHLHVERAVTPLQSNLIEAGDTKRAGEKEWYLSDGEKSRKGPFAPEELKAFFDASKIGPDTRCWAQGMDGWRPIKTVVQLKWTLMDTGAPVLNETELAVLCLSILNRLCDMYPSRDADGAIIRPLPRIKRILSEATCLPHIVNIFLTFEPILVEKTSYLLYHVMQDNPIVPRLFLTGAFLFAMMYTGSNVLPLARFLYTTHSKQAFRSEEEEQKTTPSDSRSVLNQLLPKAMVCFLENYGPEKFSEVFLGNFDTPEAIWNHEMRRFMIEKIAAHISEFTPRLLSNTHAMYQYCPMPTINYPQLEHELFCNIYYLRNLCDATRFPNWPIKNQIELLKDVLDEWKREVEKKPPSMSVDQAYQILGLEKGKNYEEGTIRKTYFRMAAKYHPDKNPDGREMFEKVNKAYEFLSASEKMKLSGPDPENIVLVLRTQSILFSRYPDVVRPYKYAGYPMLIKTIQMETNDDRLFSKPIPLLPAACELAYHTVNVSALNAEELRRENGIEIVAEAFSRCIDVVSPKTTPQETSVQVCTHLVNLYGAASQFEKCRDKIAENVSIIKNVCRCLYIKGAPLLTVGAIQCVSGFAVDTRLQEMLIQTGALWHLLLLLFGYDYTLHESGVEAAVESNEQEGANHAARLATYSLARLGGFLSGEDQTPENPQVKASLEALITYHLCQQLRLNTPIETLKLFTMNTENPNLIWNNSTRAELMEYLEDQQTRALRGADQDPSFGTAFQFSDLSKELVVGHIYVRIFNKQPNFVLENPNQFSHDLLLFLRQEGETLFKNPPGNGDPELRAASLFKTRHSLEALKNVILNNPGVEKNTIGKYKMIFFFLRMDDDSETQKNALQVIQAVSVSKDCVNGIAESAVMGNMLMLCHTLPSHHQDIVETLQALATNPKIVAECIVKGGVIYLLSLFCGSENPNVRIGTASIFSKMCADKLHGPRVTIILSKFLPPVFTDAMRESPEASVHMYEGNHENPELVWNDDAREKVVQVIGDMMLAFYREQLTNPNAKWDIPPDFEVVYSSTAGEIVVGGVFLKLFLKQPTWSLRSPKQFLVALFDKYTALASGTNPQEQPIVTVGDCLVLLLTVQNSLPAYAASIGLVNKLFSIMGSRNEYVLKTSCQIIHALSKDVTAVEAMGSTKSVEPMMHAMKTYPRSLEVMGEALKNIYEKQQPDRGTMVKQALEAKLVPYLLDLLDSSLMEVEHVSAVKAQIVGALKAMSGEVGLSAQVKQMLDESTVWNAYRDQKHDLFLTSSTTKGYLTGPVTASKGYLTNGPPTLAGLSNVPPPGF